MTAGLALLRVSVVAGRRRVDLAVPGALPVAELLPEVLAALDLPGQAYAGLRLAPLGGAPLADDRGLAAQGVPDAAVLVVVDAETPPPVRHDDVAEAVAEAAGRDLPGWPSAWSRALPLGAGLVLAAVGAVVLGVPVAAGLGGTAPPVLLAGVALAWTVLPRLALGALDALDAHHVDADHVDAGGVAERVGRAHRAIVLAGAALGLLAATLVPTVATTPAGIGLGTAVGALLLLRSRRHRARDEVLVGLGAGAAVLLTALATVLVGHPAWRVPGGLLLVGLGLLLVEARGLLPSPRVGLLGDLLEQAAVVALLPLLVLSTGLHDRVPS